MKQILVKRYDRLKMIKIEKEKFEIISKIIH